MQHYLRLFHRGITFLATFFVLLSLTLVLWSEVGSGRRTGYEDLALICAIGFGCLSALLSWFRASEK